MAKILKLQGNIGGVWKDRVDDYINIGGVQYSMTDYAANIGGVWRYAPEASYYTWRKYKATSTTATTIEYGESIEVEVEEGGWGYIDCAGGYTDVGYGVDCPTYNTITYSGGTITLSSKNSCSAYGGCGCGGGFYPEGYASLADLGYTKEDLGADWGTGYVYITESCDDYDNMEDAYECCGYVYADIITALPGMTVKTKGDLVSTVSSMTNDYPTDDLHTDGYWYELVSSPYVWSRYTYTTQYNWDKYSIIENYSAYEAYLPTYDGTVDELCDEIDSDWDNGEEFCDEVDDFDRYDEPFCGGIAGMTYYYSISVNSEGTISGSKTASLGSDRYAYYSSSRTWYYIVDKNSNDEYCMYEIEVRGTGDVTQSKGSLVGSVSSQSSSTYPANGVKNGYWYVSKASTQTKTYLDEVMSLTNDYPADGLYSDGYYYVLIATPI